jgi:Rps23 Pro-64 3,4-dihydroxylase Tpa1-like proline 4-hydroxylase
MEFKYSENPIPHIIVENFYSEQELSDVWKELEFLTNERIMVSGDKTAPAIDNNGNILKNNHGVFLDAFYISNRKASHILTYNRKFWDKEFVEGIKQCNDIFKTISLTNQDSTLLSYYENSNNYLLHNDQAIYTMLIHLYKEPKCFTGGELSLHGDGDLTYELKNNRMILFPSFYNHSVSNIIMNDHKKFSGNGRYAISQFFGLNLFL